jgi:hypothetical protein
MDRTDITPALVTGLLRDHFPQWAHLPVRRVDADGIDNTTFRLGDSMSVRLPTSDWYSKQVQKEQRWLPVLAPRLPQPIPVPLALGEFRHRGRPADGAGRGLARRGMGPERRADGDAAGCRPARRGRIALDYRAARPARGHRRRVRDRCDDGERYLPRRCQGRGIDPARLQADGTCWCGPTTWHGARAMRVSVSGWSTTADDIDRSVAAVRRAAQLR